MLGTRTLRKGGVMMHWLGRLGRCVGTSYHASFWSVCVVCSGCVLGHLIVNNDVHLHFPLYYHDVVVVMSFNFHLCLLYVSHARIDPVGSHAPHQQLFPQLEACGRHNFHLGAVSFNNSIFSTSLLARGVALLF